MGWVNHGFVNDKGGSSRAYGNRVMAMDWGRDHVLAFAHVLNVVNYAFSFCFDCFKLHGIILGLTKGGGKGIVRLVLCGPKMGMWTQVGEKINGDIVSGKGVTCSGKGVGPCIQSRSFASSTTLC